LCRILILSIFLLGIGNYPWRVSVNPYIQKR
jgi:hypothetical protein